MDGFADGQGDRHEAEVAVAVDVGGTFTDVLRLRDGALDALKVPSSPPTFEDAIHRGLEVLGDGASAASPFELFLHGTTVATNALLEARGARTALVTTKGFRDVLELSRNRNTSGLDVTWRKQAPLVPRRLRVEIEERISGDGSVLRAVEQTEALRLAERLAALEVRAVAVCLLNAYVNPVHEQQVAEVLRQHLPGVFVTASHELVPEMREYERSSTTVANAYVGPVMADYVSSLDRRLRTMAPSMAFRIMQSNGGLTDAGRAGSEPVRLIESGPAGGATAAAFLARALDERRALAFDMGGTTAKVSLVEDFNVAEVSEFTVGAGMNTSRLRRGDGHPILIPSVDIVEVGAGGGSVFWIDAVGQPHVGPHSAGADPGPICYGRGGTQVTVTDANAVLGYLNPSEIAGGTQKLELDAAREAIERDVARPLGVSLLEAAHGIVRLVNSNMARAVRAASVERGRDPRGYTMVAFGGAGPMHAAAVAGDFGIETVVVPPVPGLFSALGLLLAETRLDLVRKLGHADRSRDWPSIAEALVGLERRARSDLGAEDVAGRDRDVSLFVDLCYRGQTFTITVPVVVKRSLADVETFHDAVAAFEKAYTQVFGHAGTASEVEVVNLRARALGPARADATEVFSAASDVRGRAVPGTGGRRGAYFGPEWGVIETSVIPRDAVRSTRTQGPLIVEGEDSTVVVPPDFDLEASDETGSIVIRRSGDGGASTSSPDAEGAETRPFGRT